MYVNDIGFGVSRGWVLCGEFPGLILNMCRLHFENHSVEVVRAIPYSSRVHIPSSGVPFQEGSQLSFALCFCCNLHRPSCNPSCKRRAGLKGLRLRVKPLINWVIFNLNL